MNWLPLATALGMTRRPQPARPSVVCRDHRIYTADEGDRVLWARAWRAKRNPEAGKIRRLR